MPRDLIRGLPIVAAALIAVLGSWLGAREAAIGAREAAKGQIDISKAQLAHEDAHKEYVQQVAAFIQYREALDHLQLTAEQVLRHPHEPNLGRRLSAASAVLATAADKVVIVGRTDIADVVRQIQSDLTTDEQKPGFPEVQSEQEQLYDDAANGLKTFDPKAHADLGTTLYLGR